MSATHAPGAGAPAAGPAHPARVSPQDTAAGGSVGAWRLALVVSLGLAGLSLLGPAAPTYDPWAWIIWGREITQGELVTTYGPSWKPLPVLLTTPFALAGDSAAPLLWLLVARAGGLMAIFAAFALAARMAGPLAGLLAAAGLALSDDFVRHFARGNSEGMLVAFCLLAVLAHLDDRRRLALALGFLAGLLRPEVWPFLGLYGLWLGWREPRARLWVAGAGVTTLVLWFVPEQIGSGDWLRAASRAMQTNPDSAAQAAFPFLEVFVRAAGLLAIPVWVGAVIAVVMAVRRRGEGGWDVRLVLLSFGGAMALMVAVALMTQFGFAGNTRYLSLPASLVSVMAGVGWVWLYRSWRRHHGSRVAVRRMIAAGALSLVPVVVSLIALVESFGLIQQEAEVTADLSRAVSAAGGPAAFEACGAVSTGPYEVQMVAWELGRHGAEVSLTADAPTSVLALRQRPPAGDRRVPVVAETEHWVVHRRCSP